MPLLTFAPSFYQFPRPEIVIWDIQTGVFIDRITVDYYGDLAVNQRTIALFGKDAFCIYDGLTGTRLCGVTLPPSRGVQSGGHWTHGDSLRFAMSSETDGELVISVYELQPASSPPTRRRQLVSYSASRRRFYRFLFLPNYSPRMLLCMGQSCHSQSSGLKSPIPVQSARTTFFTMLLPRWAFLCV